MKNHLLLPAGTYNFDVFIHILPFWSFLSKILKDRHFETVIYNRVINYL